MTTTETELSQVIAELSLVSQIAARGEPSPIQKGRKHFQGKEPDIYGAAEGRDDDTKRDWPLKSADHFRRRKAKANTEKDLEAILTDARASLEAFRRQPDWKKGEAEPERKTLRWKRMIANSDEPMHVLTKRHEISPRTYYRYRELYGRNGSVWPTAGRVVAQADVARR